MAMPAKTLAVKNTMSTNQKSLPLEITLPARKPRKLSVAPVQHQPINYQAVDLPTAVTKIAPKASAALTGSNRGQLVKNYTRQSGGKLLKYPKKIQLPQMPEKQVFADARFQALNGGCAYKFQMKPIHWISALGVSLLLLVPYIFA